MPRMDGTTAMKIIQKESPLPTGPAIVAVTASAMSGDREEALKNGFQVRLVYDQKITQLTIIHRTMCPSL